jgi:DNA-binding response OmpR family regulator
VEVHVSSLRKKLGRKLGDRIVSVTGHGYKFE